MEKKLFNFSEIVCNFEFEGAFIKAEPYGFGHINDTFVVWFTKKGNETHRYILQRINNNVFKCPEKLMSNIEGVTKFLKNKIIQVGGDPKRETLNLVQTTSGASYYKDELNNYWRAYLFVEGAKTYQLVEKPEHLYNAGKAFGNFQRLLSEYPASTLFETIPDFHNTAKRFETFKEAVEKDVMNRACGVSKEIEFVNKYAEEVKILVNLLERGVIPLRVTHNDTKFNNVMIDDVSGEGICVIDLDTVMPGLSLYDYGDSIRSATNTADEDEKDLSKVTMDISLFESFTSGFLKAVGDTLWESEIEYLPFSAKIMTLECGIRFLTDYLNGDTYFKIHREGHNLDRCRTQFKLVSDIEEKFEDMKKIVEKACLKKPKIKPTLDKEFQPAILEKRAFLKAVEESGNESQVAVAIEREGGLVSNYKTKVFSDNAGMDEENFFYIERLVKSMLWIYGGWKIIIGGSSKIGEYIKKAYSQEGIRKFDADFMGKVYEQDFVVEIVSYDQVPNTKNAAKPVGRHLDGNRIGLDLGGSDRKVSAVVNGEAIYSEEIIWHPKIQSDPDYHYKEIVEALRTAASKMPSVDAIGVSSAGIYIDNRVMVASLFLKVPEELFNNKVKDIIINAANELGNISLEVANDGDVTALAGAMELQEDNVLGIAMGTSEAGGYVDGKGNITGWLNELAFVPVDYNKKAMIDEWSGDFGCGVKYFSQDAVVKLAVKAGIQLDENLTLAEKLKAVQELHEKGNESAKAIFETIGCYLGYSIAYYSEFYEIKHILVLGRVTSGEGGNLILKMANNVLEEEFPELSKIIKIHLPDEESRRVGQSIAAASLPKIG